MNFATSAAGSVCVELQDATGKPLPGYSADESDELFGDSLDRSVLWKTVSGLSPVIGQTVRIRFVLRDDDCTRINFMTDPAALPFRGIALMARRYAI